MTSSVARRRPCRSFETWQRYGTDLVELLSGLERLQLEVLLATL